MPQRSLPERQSAVREGYSTQSNVRSTAFFQPR